MGAEGTKSGVLSVGKRSRGWGRPGGTERAAEAAGRPGWAWACADGRGSAGPEPCGTEELLQCCAAET